MTLDYLLRSSAESMVLQAWLERDCPEEVESLLASSALVASGRCELSLEGLSAGATSVLQPASLEKILSGRNEKGDFW